jgi:hypothetical protein
MHHIFTANDNKYFVADEFVVVAADDDHKLINYITGIIIGPNRPRYYM